LPLEEEERGENRLGFSWAKIGLRFSQEQSREKKNYFLFLQTIFSPPFSKTCKLSCCLKYLEIQKHYEKNIESNQVPSLQKETPQVFVCNLFENFESISKHREICSH
jgi:hypothetical protein